MQSAIEEILEEKFDYESGSLDFSCTKLELVINKGEYCEGSFQVYSLQDGFTHGYVTTTDMRMECLTAEFTGNSEEIFYCFHGENMEEGNVVKGNFCIVSNHGEYYLPFVVSVRYSAPESSIGPVKNLFHFANLAKSSWDEAVTLFYSPEMYSVLEGSDRQIYDCYRGLSVNPGNEQNMEEFLIQINKKQKVDFILKEKELLLDGISEASAYAVTEMELAIVRNGWGYTALQVECEGDFVFTEKEFLSDDDFVGNLCRLPVFIDTSLCREGRNFGRIYIYNSYVSLTVPVTVKVGERRIAQQIRFDKKRKTVQLMEFYQAFRMKQISLETWLKESGKLVEELVARDERDVEARLFQAQLLISEERYNEAGWILDHAVERMEREEEPDDTLWAYYLYLTTLIRREEAYVDEVTSQVERLFRQDRTNWRIAWLLLYLSEEYEKAPSAKWDLLEKQFVYGCSSPVLYTEALMLLGNNPSLLRKLSDHSLQVLYYGARQEALKPEMVEQLLYLTGRGKEYSALLLKIFQKLYEKNKDTRILQEICTLLIRGNFVGPAYYKWYHAGVEAQLRITNLYEYYMMSLDLRTAETLPKVVLMYFSYQNNMDFVHSAFLYHYVLSHREELEEIYESYRPRIEHFMLDQIQKGRMNRHLAGIYQELLTPAMVDERMAGALAKILFAHQISVEDRRLKKVIVYQPGNLEEAVYPLQDGSAWLPIYGGDCTVLFEDAYGNRFARNAEYTMEKLMIPGKYLRMISALVKDSLELDLYLWESGRGHEELEGEHLERCLRLADDERVELSIRRNLYLRILQHYYDTEDMETLDDFLQRLPVEDFTLEERGTLLRYVVLREQYDLAWEWVQRFGPHFVEPKTLLRLLGERIEQSGSLRDQELADIAAYVFRRGKYDSRVAGYLEAYAEGDTKELRNIWKAARSFGLDCTSLSERLLGQMMFSGAYVGERMEIFEYYIAQGADERVERAFLVCCCFDYFVKEKLTDALVFEEIRRLYLQGEEMQKVCKLAYLKYYAEDVSLVDREILPVIDDFLADMHAERIHLNFFRSFVKLNLSRTDIMRDMMDKTIVEYRAKPGSRVRIHYVIMREDGEDPEYLVEIMRDAYGGCCFKEFILFFGESLQYYIMEESGEEEQLTESGNLQKSDIRDSDEDWRYEMINDIIISKTLQEYDTLDNLLDEYYHREFLNQHLFTLQ